NKYTHDIELPDFLAPCLKGFDMGIISEAGCPAIADPGAAIVKLAHEKNITIIPLVGPSSITLALMASGLNGQSFAFNGYLPIDRTERRHEIKVLENRSKALNQSQIVIETPYRNEQLLTDLKRVLRPQTLLCVACNITLPDAFIKTQPVNEWKNTTVGIHKKPCIFIIHSGI
ncbi:MAG: SAM-dependent methyltransferase, partial [Bacteroidota bacterium]